MKLFWVSMFAVLFAVAGHASERVSLKSFLGKYGFPKPKETDGKLIYRSTYTELEFKDNSRMLRHNGHLIWLCEGSFSGIREWQVSKADSQKVLAPLLRSSDYVQGNQKPRLVLIDPGHGGSQTGAKPKKGRKEKELTLDVARRLSKELAKYGIKSALTRDRDIDVTLPARTRQIGALEADVFVSIHMNSAGNGAAKGLETFVVPAAGYPSTSGGKGSTDRVVGNRNDELNTLLAYLIQRDTLKSSGAEDRGIKRARFDVIANATCPAVLVECGFLSNAEENGLLQTAAYRQSLANGIAVGLKHYISMW